MGDGDQALHVVYLIGCVVLVLGSLFVRRIPIADALKMMIAWVLIFGAAFILFTFRHEFQALWDRLVLEARGGVVQEQSGEELRVRQSADGHFYVDAQLNGQRVRFLVDSGATTTSISRSVADRAGVETGGMPAVVQTANGLVTAERGRARSLKVGTIERRDLAVHVSERFGELNVIGMNFLSSLSSWGVEGRTLVLRP
jgi:aspartyl protease family protein